MVGMAPPPVRSEDAAADAAAGGGRGWLLAGWLGKGKVIGFDYYVMS